MANEEVSDIMINENMNHKYFIFGAISGICGVTISHPFDTIKTNIQTNNKIQYNIRSLYKGLIPPLFGVGLEKALVFGSYEYSQKYFNNTFISGLFAGLTASMVVTPYERLKILLQTNNLEKPNNFNPRFLYKGLSATFTREIPGFGIYFTTYNYSKEKLYKNNIDTFGSFMLGGLAGTVAWIFIYPQDMIKTRLQSALDNKQNIKNIISDIYKTGGISQFYKGLHLALMRAIPLHAGTFSMMEILKKNFD